MKTTAIILDKRWIIFAEYISRNFTHWVSDF